MAAERSLKPSFSRGRKWNLGFQVALTIMMVLGIVVMLNYLSGHYFQRFYLSTRTNLQLSPRTLNFLKSITNRVKVTLYYDKQDPLYSTILALLKEYQNANPKITVQTVDYLRDAGQAEKIKADYKLTQATDKDVVIFDCEGGGRKHVPGDLLADYTYEPTKDERRFLRKPVAFKGEVMFTSMLMAVTNPKPLKAYFLQGHGEHRVDKEDDMSGYSKCAAILQGQNYIQVTNMFLGTNTVPMDCHLLVIAGPTTEITDELEKIEQYLNQGGRLFILFNNADSRARQTGLEKMLAKWAVNVGTGTVQDPDFTTKGLDVVVLTFSPRHPVVNPLIGSQLQLILPRPIGRLALPAQAADAPKVEVIAFSGPRAYLSGAPADQHQWPLMVAVEKGAVKGVITERGSTRMIVVGDSNCLVNHWIESGANGDFLTYAANWLLDRPQLLEGLGPKSVTEYRIVMTRIQMRALRWILLGGVPGVVSLLGGLVWLCRRR
jgi:hypothetical protein